MTTTMTMAILSPIIPKTSMRAWYPVLLMSLASLGGVRPSAEQQPVPQPFPRPAQPPTARPPQPTAQAPTPSPVPPDDQAPVEEMLGLPIYPGSTFLGSYDASRGQRFYLYGSNIGFSGLVSYYTSVLKTRGDLVFEAPATHVFEVGRFREETMAFPPGVTVKDYTWRGSQGYLDPRPGADPARFRTVIQIVPLPPDSRR